SADVTRNLLALKLREPVEHAPLDDGVVREVEVLQVAPVLRVTVSAMGVDGLTRKRRIYQRAALEELFPGRDVRCAGERRLPGRGIIGGELIRRDKRAVRAIEEVEADDAK